MNMPMLSRKAFVTNSLKWTFVLDVWFDGQIGYSKIEHLSNIDEIRISIINIYIILVSFFRLASELVFETISYELAFGLVIFYND